MPPIVVTASTSVVLVNSSNQPIPTVYFPAISTLGRLVTVRDSDGFVSTGNYIYLQGCNGVTFGEGLSTLSITQPFGFLTLNATSQNNYSIVNTFAFPLGSTAAYVSNVTASTMYITNTIYSRDLATLSTNTITTSNGELCFNTVPTGTVTPAQLTSTTIAVEEYASNLLFINVRRTVAIGVTSSNLAGSANPIGTIIYSDNNTPFDLSDGGTGGFSNGGTDVYYGAGLWVAVGDNRGTTPTGCNTGFIQWSTDGKYWVNSVSPNLNANRLRNRVYWDNNRYHAVGYNNALGTSGGPFTILHSGNGKSWVPSLGTPFQGTTSTLNYATGIAFGRGVWVASGLQEANITGSSLLWSPDGSNWNQANSTDWFNTPDAKAYDVAYNAGNFIALVNNDTLTTNLAISTDGSNWATAGITNGGLNNEPGYLGYSPDQWIVVTQNYHKFSVDEGYTWNTIQDFPTGYPFRPYYDGATWWVSVSTNSTAQSIYYSFNGSNQWSNWLTGGGFENGGYAKSFYSIFAQSNLNLQLLSSMQGISINFATSNLSACNINANNISANAITLGTDAITTRTNFQVACIETSNAIRSLFWSDDDGLTYNAALSGGFNNGANGVGYNGTGLWVAVGGYSNSLTGPNNPLSSIQWSTNGKNWNAAASGGFSWDGSTICEGVDIAYANGYWIAVGCNDDFSRTILRSTDGSNWSAVGANTKFSSIGYSIASGTNALGQFMWVAVGQGSSQTNTIQYSVDNGGTWANAASGGFTSLTARAVAYGYDSGNLPAAGRWVAVGVPSSIPDVDGIQYSDNGSNWQNTGSQTYMNHLSVEWNPFKSQYVATGGFNAAAGGTLNRQSTLVTSVNGITWNSATTGGFRAVAGQLGGTSVTFNDSNWFASGVSTNGLAVIVASSDGSNWTPNASPAINTSTINQLTNGITTSVQVIGKVFISAGTILANTINMNNGLITNLCSIRFTKIDIAGTSNTSVSLGTNAGRLNQSQDAIAIGTSAGFSNQQPNAIAIGNFTGQFNQNGIAIGQNAGLSNQLNSIALGPNAAMLNQLGGSVALGSNAGMSNQSYLSVAIGTNAGMSNQLNNSVAIGVDAASYGQRDSAIAIGRGSGLRNQGAAAIAIGDSCGTSNQGFYSVAVGPLSAIYNQAPNAVAIGRSAGNSNQQQYGVAVGFRAGTFSQNEYCIGMGFLAGDSNQGTAAVALGVASGANNQGPGGVGLGQHSGANSQGSNAIAIGGFAGNVQQSTNSIAIGYFTASYYQDSNAVAVGSYAGFSNQGPNSIAIGYMAGSNITSSNSIILNATGSALNSSNPSAFYVMPVRSNVGTYNVYYNDTSGEISYGTASGGGITDRFSTLFTSSFVASTITLGSGRIISATNALAIGNGAGASQQVSALAIGSNCGSAQQAFAIAIGSSAGIGTQNQNAIAIGNSAGFSGQGEASIAIGRNTASGGQASNAIALGDSAGQNQSTGCIAIGFYAGNQNQLANSIAIGYEAGTTAQSSFSIAIGHQAGRQYQNYGSIAFGCNAGYTTQGLNSVAIGTSAASNVQGSECVAIGNLAGVSSQGGGAIGIGKSAGQNSQGTDAIAIGKAAGNASQGSNSIAIGFNTAGTNQGIYCVAIGDSAGGNYQSNYSIAIGAYAGQTNQHTNSIVLNASGTALNTTNTSAFYVNPIRNVAGDVNLQWNTTSFEVSYQSSDSNVKREIETARNYLDDLCKLRPVTFKYISSMEGIPEKKYLGFIAQEVQEIFPSMVFEYQSTLILNDNAIPAMLVTAVQSLQSTNQGLQSRLDRQEQLLQALYSTLNINP